MTVVNAARRKDQYESEWIYPGFAELQQQISKQIRGYGDRIGLLEEMADAYICLRFLESIFDIEADDLQKAIDVKLDQERGNLNGRN